MHMKPRFLATTALEGLWDTSHPLLFFNEGGKRFSRREYWLKLEHETLNFSWPEPDRVDDAYLGLVEECAVLLHALVPTLNAIHGTEHTERYWRIMLHAWVSQYLAVLVDRYSALALAADRYPSLIVSGSPQGGPALAGTSWEFATWVREDLFNQWLYADIATELGLQCRHFETSYADLQPRAGARGRFRSIRQALNGLAHAYRPGDSILMRDSYFDLSSLAHFAMASAGLVRPVHPPSRSYTAHVDASLRQRLKGMISSEGRGVSDIARRLLARYFPTCFLEGYRSLCESASAMYPSRPRAVFTANGLYYDETFKHWIGICTGAGTLLLGSQHGGTFGVLRGLIGVEFELTVTDRFYTWGHEVEWRGKRSHAMPASKFVSLDPASRRGRKQNQRILLGGTIAPRFNQAALASCAPPAFAQYLDWQGRFIEALDAKCRSRLRYRMHETDLGWDIRERLQDRIPGLEFDDNKRSFRDSLAECDLFVCDYIGTIYAEAIAAMVPTILFWDPLLSPLTPEAEPVFSELRRQGVLHDSPESAAEAAGLACRDVDAWWQVPERRLAILAFRESFARHRDDAVAIWKRKFETILSATTESREDS